eukprot:g356.t1
MALRHLKKLRVVYAGFDSGSAGVREFWRLVTTPAMMESNPKIEMVCEVSEAAREQPTVQISYSNDEVLDIQAQRKSAKQLLGEMAVISNRIEHGSS